MSEKKKWQCGFAERIADGLLSKLVPCCDRFEIAGSIRRGKPMVGDVELLYIPTLIAGKPVDMFSPPPMVNLTDNIIEELLADKLLGKRLNVNGHIAGWGPNNKLAVHIPTGLPIDLFATTAENWYVSLVIRTGGKDTNLMLTTGANKKNLTLNAYGCGVTNRATGEVTKANSEREVFELCGVEYREPEDRQ